MSLSELVPSAVVGRQELANQSFKAIAPHFSDSFVVNFINVNAGTTLQANLVVYYNRIGNTIYMRLPAVNVANTGILSYLAFQGPFPINVQDVLLQHANIGAANAFVNAANVVGIWVLNPNNASPNLSYVSLGTGTGTVANATLAMDPHTVSYFTVA